MFPDPPLPDDLRRALAEIRRVFGPSARVVDVEEVPGEPSRSFMMHHVQLAMPGGERAARQARAFYGETLGLPEIPGPPEAEGRGGVRFRGGPLEVSLEVEDGPRPARATAQGIVVGEEEGGGLAARVRRLGTPLPPGDEEVPGYRRFDVHDPFGNRLEFLVPEATETES